MRVRYQMVGGQTQVRCDLEDKQAKKLFGRLFSDGLCEWAELVGEDDDNYMDVLESFDHIDLARSMAKIVGEIREMKI